MNRCRPVAVAAASTLLFTVSACGGGGSSNAPATTNQVTAGDSTCEVEKTRLDGGRTTFEVKNVGSKATEVYVYGRAGDGFTKIIGEKENIGPGTSQKFEVDLAAGEYQVACKPGMTGDGIRADLAVTGTASTSPGADAGYDREAEFEVSAKGAVKRSPVRTAKVAERIEFKLENEAGSEYYLEVLDPDGTRVGRVEAEGGQEAEFVAEIDMPGKYQVRVFRDGDPAHAKVFAVTAAA